MEADCAIIYGRNVKTIVGNVVVNFEAASSSNFRDIKKTFCDGGGHRRYHYAKMHWRFALKTGKNGS